LHIAVVHACNGSRTVQGMSAEPSTDEQLPAGRVRLGLSTSGSRFESVLGEMVSTGSLSAGEADRLRTASRWSFGVRDSVVAFGGLLVFSGALVAVSSVASAFSREGFSLLLLVLSLGVFVIRRRVPVAMTAVRELLEILVVALACFAAGVTLDDASQLSGEWIGIVVSLPVLAQGVRRAGRSWFAGVVQLLCSSLVATAASVSLLDRGQLFSTAVFLLLGAVLLLWSWRSVFRGVVLARSAGTLIFSVSALVFANEARPLPSQVSAFLALVLLSGLFVFGASSARPEVLVPAAFALTFSVHLFAGEFLSGGASGFAVLVVGSLLLAVSLRRLKQ